MISAHVYAVLEQHGPMTVEEISEAIQVPRPHIRAAVAELCFKDRKVTCVGKDLIRIGTPPDTWARQRP